MFSISYFIMLTQTKRDLHSAIPEGLYEYKHQEGGVEQDGSSSVCECVIIDEV